MPTSDTADRATPHPHQTVEELTRSNVETIARMEEAAQRQRTRTDCVVDSITKFCGRIAFVYWHIAFFTFWIVANTAAPKPTHFDPYPFQFLTLAVSLEAIFLSAFILISQNRGAQLDQRRNELELQISLLSEQENTKILQMLDAIAQKLEVTIEGDPDIEVLEAATRPEMLIEQIEAAHKRGAH